MKLKIKVTKEVLKKTQYCAVGRHNLPEGIPYVAALATTTSCAIAVAVRDIFPRARVSPSIIQLTSDIPLQHIFVELPDNARSFIKEFDSLREAAGFDRGFDKRLEMDELEFEIEVPEEVIDSIGIEDYMTKVEKSETLELV
jgi:hypothetical protein